MGCTVGAALIMWARWFGFEFLSLFNSCLLPITVSLDALIMIIVG